MVLNRYAAALLQIAIIVIGAFSALQPSDYAHGAAWGLVGLAAQALITYFVPLLHGTWQAGLKTGLSAVIAVLTLGIPYFANGGALTPAEVGVFILAALNTLAAEVGVQIRLDSHHSTVG